jgi:membrane associated rhomboid family serine protease
MFVSIPSRQKPSVRWATPALAVVLLVAFVWAWLQGGAAQGHLRTEWGALTGGMVAPEVWLASLQRGTVLRLFTALFLHADWAHLAGNLVFLLIFGLPAERVLGPWRLLLLFLVGFLPQEQNLLANAIVSFACAMQVQAFRKVNGYAFASTMCIGDLRSGVEALCIWRKTHEPQARDRMLRYFGIILLFAIGAGIGSRSAALLGGRAIWICCGFLLVSFALMFIREDLEENPVIEKDLTEIRQETREINHALKQELQEEHRELKESTEPRKK